MKWQLAVFAPLLVCTCVGCSSSGMHDPGPAVVTVAPTGADYSSIQAAVDSSPPGTMIEIAAGTYVEHVVIDKGLVLVGAGSTTVVELPADLLPLPNGGIEIRNATGVSLYDLSVVAVALDVDGIYIKDSSDIVIDSVVASDSGDEGVHIAGSSDAQISGTFMNNIDHGIHVREDSTRVTVSDSVASENGGDGIKLTDSTDCVVRDNTTSQNGDEGIQAGTFSAEIVIEGNLSTLNAAHGIRVSDSIGGRVADNVSTHNTKNGIWVTQPPPGETQVVVENNTAHSNGEEQVFVK